MISSAKRIVSLSDAERDARANGHDREEHGRCTKREEREAHTRPEHPLADREFVVAAVADERTEAAVVAGRVIVADSATDILEEIGDTVVDIAAAVAVRPGTRADVVAAAAALLTALLL